MLRRLLLTFGQLGQKVKLFLRVGLPSKFFGHQQSDCGVGRIRLYERWGLIARIGVRYIFRFSTRHSAGGRVRVVPSFAAVLAFCGIGLSTMILVVVTSVMNGFYNEFSKLVMGVNPHVTVLSVGSFEERAKLFDVEGLLAQGALFSRVSHVGRAISGRAMIASHEGVFSSGAVVYALRKEDFFARDTLKDSIKFGAFGDVVLGEMLAESLRVSVGDEVTLIIPRGNVTMLGVIPVHKRFVVSGIFAVGMQHYDSGTVFLGLGSGVDLITYGMQKYDEDDEGAAEEGAEDIVGFDSLEITLRNADDVEAFTRDITQMLDAQLGYGAFRVYNWKTQNVSFLNAIRMQANVMSFIMILFVILSSFVIASTLSSTINSKKHSTAILKTMGLGRREAALVFLFNGGVISLAGVAVGCLAGVAVALNIGRIKDSLEMLTGRQLYDPGYYFLSYLPSEVVLSDIVKVMLFCVGVSLVALFIASRGVNRAGLAESLKNPSS